MPRADPEWPVMALAELPDPGAREFCVGEDDWPFRGFVVRWRGEVYAYANVCPHQRHPLNLGPADFFTPDCASLRCSSHGAEFAPATGECVAGPCVGAALRALPVRVAADGTITVAAPASMRE